MLEVGGNKRLIICAEKLTIAYRYQIWDLISNKSQWVIDDYY